MGLILNIKNLNYKYDDKVIFKNFNLSINQNSWTTIIGDNSGKSTLLKLINKNNKSIEMYHYSGSKNNLRVFLIKNFYYFKKNRVVAEFNQYVNNYSNKNFKFISDILNLIDKQKIFEYSINKLDLAEKQILAIAVTLYQNPDLLLLDDCFCFVDNIRKEKILKIIQRYQKTNKISVIYVTNESDDLLLSDRIILLKDGHILSDGGKNSILEHEKEFRKIGMKRPFIVELSSKLKYYNLVEKLYLSDSRLVKDLWN